MHKTFLGYLQLTFLAVILYQDVASGQFTNNTTSPTNNTTCQIDQFTCSNGNCVDQSLVCNGVDNCGDGTDERTFMCKRVLSTCWRWQKDCHRNKCRRGTFQCDNGKCINVTDVCDRVDHCGDGTDELRYAVGFKCPIGRKGDTCVLPRRHVNDRYPHCINEEDESVTEDKVRRLFVCFDKSHKISQFQMCDGVIDCPDLSDECACENRTNLICDNFCKKVSSMENCTFRMITCGDGVQIFPNQVCDGKVDCPRGLDERHCSKHSKRKVISCPGNVHNTSRKLARLCDGRPECYDLSDECNPQCGRKQPAFCNLKFANVPFQRECKTDTGTLNFTVEHICDGEFSPCNLTYEESGCYARHYCTSDNLISIDNTLKCNGYTECDEGSDEDECSGSRFSCRVKRTRGGQESVPVNFVVDGVADCANAKDECPTDLDDFTRPIGSQTDLLGINFFQTWVWIVGLSCVIGNGLIIGNKLRHFKSIQKSAGLAKCNHLLVFNLALADSIMGIYLLGIAFKQVQTRGRYCRHDVQWRTSATCFWLGATAVVSSEASLFMLTILTTLRLLSVHSPLKFRNIKVKWIAIPIFCAWCLAVLIGFLPHPLVSREQFTRGAFVKSKFISSTMIDLSSLQKFAISLSRVSENATAVTITPFWSDVANYLNTHFPRMSVAAYYGYYSEYSVCMPNFYVTQKEKMWGYSFVIILINFLIFIYIALSYIAIYKRATRQKIQSTADAHRSKLQTKIIRIIISDMLCWVPICLLAFLTFSNNIRTSGPLYAATAVIILPTNSVLNPFLYSDILDILWSRTCVCKRMIIRKLSKHEPTKTDSTELSKVQHTPL